MPVEGGSNPPQHVFIGVPCYDWKVHVQFMASMLDTFAACLQAGISITVRTLSGNCHVDDAQNELIAEFLKTDCTDMVIIGSDQGWKAKDFVRLCQHDRDIVAGAVCKKQKDEAYTILLDADEIWADDAGLVEAFTIGSGFLRMRRSVVDVLASKAIKHDDGVPVVFERIVREGKRWSGDNVLCLKARELGYRIWVDPDMDFEHVGQKVWTGNLHRFWLKEAA
jgi:hypothetical protein